MTRTVKYLTSNTQRIYNTPSASPETAGVYEKTKNPQGVQAPASAPAGIPSTQFATPQVPQAPTVGQLPEYGQLGQAKPTDQMQDFSADYMSFLEQFSSVEEDGTAPPKQVKKPAPNLSAGYRAGAYAQRKIVDIAKKYIGMNRYVYGGWDCSKFTQTVAQKSGVKIPRTAATQFNWFKQKKALVNMKNARPGDVVFLRSSGSPSGWHVGIYVGNGKMIDNSGKGRPIAVRNIWGKNILGFGRMPIKHPKAAPVKATASPTRYGGTQLLIN